MKREIAEMKRLLAESVEMKFYAKRNSVNQFCITSVSGVPIPKDYVLLISLDKTGPEANWNYFGEVEIFYCRKKGNVLKTEKSYKAIYTHEQWNGEIDKISLADILDWANISPTQESGKTERLLKIKEVEQRVGMTRANIRYYEEEGLLKPIRNQENNYREYSEENIRSLERIKVLRTLGISIADIKKLNDGNISMKEIMDKRLQQIGEEEQMLRETEKVCQEICLRELSFAEIDEKILGENKNVWQERFEKIGKEDVTKEILTPRQCNRNLAGMLLWGYFISAVTAALAGDWLLANVDGYWIVGIGIVAVFCYIAMYFTANVKILLAIFHIEAVLLSPLAAAVMRIAEDMSMGSTRKQAITGKHMAVFWLAIVIYVALLFWLSEKRESFMKKAGCVLSVGVAYAGVMTVAVGVISDLWLYAAIVFLVFTLFLGMNWYHLNEELPKSGASKYFAVVNACRIMNIAGCAQNMKGKTTSTTVFR